MDHEPPRKPIACSARPVRQPPRLRMRRWRGQRRRRLPSTPTPAPRDRPARRSTPPFCRGKANFHDRTLAGLGGNGRACSDCHMDSENFQLTPAAAQARFAQMTTTGVDDPLFRAIDADDFRVNGAAAHDFTNLTQNGLVRVTIPLPANVKLLDCGATVPCPASARPTSETVADVWRAVPSILDVNITGPDGAGPASPRGPNPSGGYQLDGRIDTLQNQALSALRNHAGITVDPPASFLDDLAAFQNAQFSSPSVKALSDAIAAGTSPLPDPDPVLNALETAGKAVFNRSCAQCHGNMGGHPSGSTPILQGTPGTPTALIRYHSILPRVRGRSTPSIPRASCSRRAARARWRTCGPTRSPTAARRRAARLAAARAPQPACVTRVTTSDPGRMLLTGYPVPGGPGDIQHFDNPSLRGISPHRAVLPQQYRRDARRRARALQAVLQARRHPATGGTTPYHAAGRRSSRPRPSVYRRRGSGAPRLPAQALRIGRSQCCIEYLP